ncbi:uncharacterized protein LOC100427957 [Macaca mulatta]
MDGLRGACGRGAPVFGAVLAAMRDWQELRCSQLPSRPPFHIQQRRRGQPRRRFFTSPAPPRTCRANGSERGSPKEMCFCLPLSTTIINEPLMRARITEGVCVVAKRHCDTNGFLHIYVLVTLA